MRDPVRATWDIGDMLAMIPAWGKAPGDACFDGARETLGTLVREAAI